MSSYVLLFFFLSIPTLQKVVPSKDLFIFIKLYVCVPLYLCLYVHYLYISLCIYFNTKDWINILTFCILLLENFQEN